MNPHHFPQSAGRPVPAKVPAHSHELGGSVERASSASLSLVIAIGVNHSGGLKTCRTQTKGIW